MKKIIPIFIIIITTILLMNCTVKEKASFKPLIKDVNEISMNIEIDQNVTIAEESINNKHNSIVVLSVLDEKENSTSLKCTMEKFEVITNIDNQRKIPAFNEINRISYDFDLSPKGDINITNINTLPSGNNSEAEYLKSSLEQHIGLLIKGLPQEEIEVNNMWVSTFELPLKTENDKNAKKIYKINYKFDKYNAKSHDANILMNGTIMIEGKNIKETTGTIKGLMNFNTEKGFARRINADETYTIKTNKEKIGDIEVSQNILINISFD